VISFVGVAWRKLRYVPPLAKHAPMTVAAAICRQS
jgi:hypothetical protein